ERGFALVRDADGTPVRSAAAAMPGAALSVQFHDGDVGVTVDGEGGPRRPSPSPRKPQGAKPEKGKQGSLF
ncbi:MAG: exodeoxyribonuclease VII large subunit, partial [Rhodobiaceae bacterium]|nr:exodeoxyribonuclease VII large subunit [Rhodobiaceae bacterium]